MISQVPDIQGHNRDIFQGPGKGGIAFPDFFCHDFSFSRGGNFHFGRPIKCQWILKNEKQKKWPKKYKKRILIFFRGFFPLHLSFFSFPPPFFFSSYSSTFFHFLTFIPCLVFPITQQKIPSAISLGHCTPLPHLQVLLRHCWHLTTGDGSPIGAMLKG